MSSIRFLEDNEVFSMNCPENVTGLYFPLAGENIRNGIQTDSLKSAITPSLNGDCKVDQNTFLMEPASIENLHDRRSGRNFWCKIKGKGVWSATGVSAEQENDKFTFNQEESKIRAGFMWQEIERTSAKYGLKAVITSFIPTMDQVEIMAVEITNISNEDLTVTPMAVIPVYGRSAENIRDHRHVTSLLNRIVVNENGVEVSPTMSFDERGHQKNNKIYYVAGMEGTGRKPVCFFPTVEEWIGEGGSFTHPRAVYGEFCGETTGIPGGRKPGYEENGQEACGGMQFEEIILKPGTSAFYTVILGVTEEKQEISRMVQKYETMKLVQNELVHTKEYWEEKVNLKFHTGKKKIDRYLSWICFQPLLRRIFGCSFLPYHDYGKGGRGWRDLWQDCLALLIMNPDGVREMILNNFAGVRMDGSNATIIGEKPGEFLADRNHITRVWMDHGFWPYLTTELYLNQTGDLALLEEEIPYFKDGQVARGTAVDEKWDLSQGTRQQEENGTVYMGSVLEHLLLQNLCAFYEVGEHNLMRLRGADWNDALDMAEERGESVAFSCAYAGNLEKLALLLQKYSDKTGKKTVKIATEMLPLISKGDKTQNLLTAYENTVLHFVSGNKTEIALDELSEDLMNKSEWLKNQIRSQEWVTDGEGNGWFNGYYDNHGNQVEGHVNGMIRMMLTGQVFSIMGRVASKEQVTEICKSADKYLYQKEIGGYRLNTDFKEVKMDLGRMFGFAYGEKENGAVFSHMTVMYANALYQRGFVKEGNKALQSLLDTAMDFNTSKIYPGIPEYFNGKGRGMYHYLTGAASWYMLTMVNEVYGVRGDAGDLVFNPKLMPEQFDETNCASIELPFAGRKCMITYTKDAAVQDYEIKNVMLNGKEIPAEYFEREKQGDVCQSVKISRDFILQLDNKENVNIKVILGNRG